MKQASAVQAHTSVDSQQGRTLLTVVESPETLQAYFMCLAPTRAWRDFLPFARTPAYAAASSCTYEDTFIPVSLQQRGLKLSVVAEIPFNFQGKQD